MGIRACQITGHFKTFYPPAWRVVCQVKSPLPGSTNKNWLWKSKIIVQCKSGTLLINKVWNSDQMIQFPNHFRLLVKPLPSPGGLQQWSSLRPGWRRLPGDILDVFFVSVLTLTCRSSPLRRRRATWPGPSSWWTTSPWSVLWWWWTFFFTNAHSQEEEEGASSAKQWTVLGIHDLPLLTLNVPIPISYSRSPVYNVATLKVLHYQPIVLDVIFASPVLIVVTSLVQVK